ncbi:hypothetical protein [Mycobacterium sp. GA-2829]|uniref:hypothetical protein n=1 Tax=Mycobacterium sp. GA-2829 TaxID=1772283 RepID=UPI001E4C3808|nr:hypothetical protein [Mycobacterium sp. GA-2829]
MRWLMDVCPNSLGWQAWLILCAVVVVLWAAAIAGAAALFNASRWPRRSGRPDVPEEADSQRRHRGALTGPPARHRGDVNIRSSG